VKNQCKGNTPQLFPFYLPHPLFFHVHSNPWFVCVLARVGEALIQKLLLWWKEILIFFHFKMFSQFFHVIHPCSKEYMLEKNILWKPFCEAKLLWNIIFFFLVIF
jgi:hypothetical protein